MVIYESNTYKVVYWPGREQMYTVWNKKDKQVVKFTGDEGEARSYGSRA